MNAGTRTSRLTKSTHSATPRTSTASMAVRKPAGEQAISAALYQEIRAAVRELQTRP